MRILSTSADELWMSNQLDEVARQLDKWFIARTVISKMLRNNYPDKMILLIYS